MDKITTIVWFRQDLRIEDNEALLRASEQGHVIPVFIWSPEEEGNWPLGGALKWWLHHSLLSLDEDLKHLGMNLVLRKGHSLEVLNEIISESKATSVYWNRRYEPASIERDTKIKSELRKKNIEAKSFNATLLFEPWTIANKQGKPFQVFTPFWKTCTATTPVPAPPIKTPAISHDNNKKIKSDTIESFDLLPHIHWDEGIQKHWNPGTKHAKAVLANFLDKKIDEYIEGRNFPEQEGISHLSPYLHFGEISSRMIWHAVLKAYPHHTSKGVQGYLRQLGWREFAHHLLYHFPKTPEKPLRDDFTPFPWEKSKKNLKLWQKGLTGYPFVDAGMRQLWVTGWMHNRVRMVVGSFLVKHLLISWLEGAKWFWDTLVDADLANNTMGWQWVGGCGADAAPYFRIFNPMTQGEKFDKKGVYIRKWIPELAGLSDKWIHKPWEAPESELRQAGITLGKDYPYPLVDHMEARKKALAAFATIRREEKEDAEEQE